ncbi:MAG: recombinase family protein [Clostridia bacterium]|nr:recombinase family protein [Clostridia bacterium]
MKIIYGYHVIDDKICLKENEAAVIKLIYDMYLKGNSLRKISDELFNRGVKSPSGKDRWSAQYIDNVLTSKKYIDIVTFDLFIETCVEREIRSKKAC